MSVAKLFMASVLAKGEASHLLKHGPINHLFLPHELELLEFVKKFVHKYQKLPAPKTVFAHLKEELPEPKETPEYYLDIMRLRHIEVELKYAMKQVAGLVGPDHKDPEAALQVMADAVLQLLSEKYRHQIIDFRHAHDPVIGDHVHQWQKDDESGIRLGWPTLDEMTGGLERGDMVSIVGRPATGKTMQMVYASYTCWYRQKRSTLLVSMEMKPLQILKRLAALHTSIPMNWIKHAELPTNSLKKLKGALTEVEGFDAPLWVADGDLSVTVEDVWAMARQLQPDAIFIDGAYLLKHPRERDRYKRVAENADLIKQKLSELAPTICSWQFSRDASKKGKKTPGQVGLEDIGYTDVIGQVSSLVLGLFEGDSPETLKQRRIEILKGRNGEVGSFVTRWDWHGMNFEEVLEEPIDLLHVA